MTQKQFAGVTDEQKISPAGMVRDHRSMVQRMLDWLNKPANMVVSMLMLAGVAFYYAEIGAWALMLALLLAAFALTRSEKAPLKVPIQAAMPDPNQPHPATGAPTPGQGIFFIGNDLRTGKEVWLTNSDCRQHFLVLGTTGAGKALSTSALVHTPTGWRRMGDLMVGDLVSTPDGQSAPITGYFPQGELEMCRLTFEDGRVLDGACPEHLWEIHRDPRSQGMSGSGATRPTVVTTRRLAELLSGNQGAFHIRLPAAVEKPVADLPLDPYLLGTLLTLGERAGSEPMPEVIRELGLPGLDPTANFVPEVYKEASVAQRKALIQGLMAPLGSSATGATLPAFTTTSARLAADFQELIRSLGGIARLDGDQRGFHVHVRHPDMESLFSSSQTVVQAGGPSQQGERLNLRVTRVEMGLRREEAACILVDHPDHLFITNDYVVTHNTETLLGFAANALSWGSGFLFCDGKGDVALFAKVYAMARRFGREDDLLVLNFMNGNEDVGAMGGRLRSNTMNPFATGSSDGLTQMVVSLMDEVGGDGAMWKGRATAMLTGVMRALCFLRDNGLLDLNVGEIRDHMQLKRIIALGDEKEYPDIPPHIRKSIKSYLSSLPGYQEDKKEKQAQTTLDQHGYLEMQFTKILGSLADVYGHIFYTPYGQVDMHDVVLNRRILVIMLPALEKSDDEIANLGKIVVATLKGMMGGTLGSRLEGNWADVVENRPTNSPSPFLCILDEVGYYTVEGMALMAAQARSLGFSMIYASQDIPAMKRLNEKEAASIIANTNTKVFMRTEEVNETGKLAVDTGDKAVRMKVGGMERQVGELSGVHFTDGAGAQFEEANRISFTDLKAQGEGEMHVLFQEKLVRARSFYANPEGSVTVTKLKLRANHFIEVAKPSMEDMESAQRIPEITGRLIDPGLPKALAAEAEARAANLDQAAASGDEIAILARTFDRMVDARRKQVDASCAAVADVIRALRGATSAFVDDVASMHRQGVPVDVGGSGEFELDGPGGDIDGAGHRNSPFRGDGDPFAVPPGVPFSDSPPPVPPKRPFGPAPLRKPPKVDPGVTHGASVDDSPIVRMADNLTANETLMRSLAALDFDADQKTTEQVNSDIEEALHGGGGAGTRVPLDSDRLTGSVEAFDRAATSIRSATAPDNATSAKAGDDDEDVEGGAAAGGEEGGELVSAFLEQLLLDDEER